MGTRKNSFEFKIVQHLVHPQYTEDYINYDIALFKLDRKAQFNQYVHPICLSSIHLKPEDKIDAIASEWGNKIEERLKRFGVSKILMQTIPHWECEKNFMSDEMLENGIDINTMLCAAAKAKNKYSCEDKTGTLES